MELINTHCHTVLSGHGEGTVEEYVRAAEAAGLSTLAFTEHYPLSDAYDPDHRVSMTYENVSRYREDIERARKDHPHIELIIGTELDYLAEGEDRDFSGGQLSPFALVLGSVHLVDGWAFDNPAERDRWEEPGAPDAIWSRYFELWCAACADASLPYDVMSHPDLPKKFAYYPTFDLKPYYEQAAEVCASAGRMIEVNTSGAYYACKEMFPAPAFLEAFRRAGVPCTVGADSHVPGNVARGIEDAYKLMYEAGYRVVTVPTKTGDRRTISL